MLTLNKLIIVLEGYDHNSLRVHVRTRIYIHICAYYCRHDTIGKYISDDMKTRLRYFRVHDHTYIFIYIYVIIITAPLRLRYVRDFNI